MKMHEEDKLWVLLNSFFEEDDAEMIMNVISDKNYDELDMESLVDSIKREE